MTHSLHRSGTVKSMRGDYVWLMYQAKGINDKNIAGKALEFIAVAEAVGSENWGDVKSGPTASFAPSEIKKRVTDQSRLRGCFTSRAQVTDFLKQIKARDLGLSVIISGLLDEVLPACKDAGVTPHTINYAAGVWGKKELLPSDETLAVTTMCGHHMVPPGFVEQLRDEVRAGRRKPEDAGRELATFCPCGIFNPVRAAKILKGEV